MAEFFLELFSEEIPARMQQRGAEDLARLIAEALAPLAPGNSQLFWGPRRIALAVEIRGEVAAREVAERGPRLGAPEAALAGFLRKHGAARENLVAEGDYWVLRRTIPGQSAAEMIAGAMPGVLWRFPWPKSMRWGGKSRFTWVRPLRRIVCLLDGEVVPFDVRQGEDDGHGLASGNETEGHRFMAPGAFAVHGAEDWRSRLRERFVIANPAERRQRIAEGIAAVARARNLRVVPDDGLLDEVTGLVEWPVTLLGTIDAAFMDLPAEVRQVSMRVNQRYFALLDAKNGAPAPHFAFVANIAAEDEGAAIIAGNERVLRARLSDARHFYDLDRRMPLASRVEALKTVTFHARLGTQYERAKRLERLAGYIAPLVGADPEHARRAGLLAKADLTTGMVGEFPELQGVMGYYYALHDGEPREIAEAIRDHYLPKGAGDAVPTAPVSIAVALADKFDQLALFFAIDERPTGSGDPYALRRAALGIIRIIREHRLRLALHQLINVMNENLPRAVPAVLFLNMRGFILDRLKIQLREEGLRHDIASAAFFAQRPGERRDDLLLLIAKAQALADLLKTEDGMNLLAGYRRAVNILRIEDKKDGPHAGEPDPATFVQPEEYALYEALESARGDTDTDLRAEDFAAAMRAMARLRPPIDAFFENVTVNDPDPALRRNRLRLLSRIRDTMNRFADFSLIEG